MDAKTIFGVNGQKSGWLDRQMHINLSLPFFADIKRGEENTSLPNRCSRNSLTKCFSLSFSFHDQKDS